MKKTYLSVCLLVVCFNLIAQTQTVGLFTHLTGSLDDGYVLFAPLQNCDTTYLIDKCGKEVHKWPSQYAPGADAYILHDGSLLRSGHYANPVFDACNCGTGGIIERIDWNGNLTWHYLISDTLQVQSHDICPLPNGNILVNVWENITAAEASANGRRPGYLGTRLYSPKVVELKPIGTDSAQIVWSWRAWDHLIQEFDVSKANYGTVKDHPELINLNYVNLLAEPAKGPDWTHMNTVEYNEDLDQIILSAHNLNEIWIIDHSTTTVEAASHAGGKHNKGGDLLYRWGNPATYNRGTSSNTKFFQQHNATWVTNGKYKGQIMVFNNGFGRTGGSNYSSVDIFQPPIDSAGNYAISGTDAYGPSVLTWSYQSATPTDFYSMYMGSAQVLSNGNTLICSGVPGTFFEIDTLKRTVWKYINPVDYGAPLVQGTHTTFNSVYKCIFYPASYTGFIGHSLTSGVPIEFNPLPYTCSLDTADTTTSTTIITAANNKVSIFPNPVNTTLSFKFSELRSASIIDLTGRIVISAQYFNSGYGTFNTSALPNGVYILCINDNIYNRIFIQH